MIGAGFAALGVLVWSLVHVSRSAGASVAREDSMQKGAERRAKFDEENSKPLVTDGRKLSDQLRKL